MLTPGQNSTSNEARLACSVHFQMYSVTRRQHGIVKNRKKKIVSLFPFVAKIFNLKTRAERWAW